MRKFLKGEKGSITILVLTTMLVVVSVMFMAYFSNMNKILAQEKEINKIQEEYMQGSVKEVMEQAYAETMQDYKPKLVRKWVNKIDGNGEEEFLDVEKTSDGGYIAVGYTTSTNISGLTNKGSADCLIAKYDANGNEEWKKSVGGSKYDWYNSVIEIKNGTYIAVGTILSTDVVDKNGNNTGHGYDWNFSEGPFSGSMVATEGIIGTYDKNGNEVSLKITGEATNKYTAEQYLEEGGNEFITEFDMAEYSTSNALILGIDKTSDGNYVITGRKTVGVPSSFASNIIESSMLAIKYDKEGNKIKRNELEIGGNISGIVGNISPKKYNDLAVRYGGLKGMKEDLNGSYFLYGYSNGVGTCTIFILDSNLTVKNRQSSFLGR